MGTIYLHVFTLSYHLRIFILRFKTFLTELAQTGLSVPVGLKGVQAKNRVSLSQAED